MSACFNKILFRGNHKDIDVLSKSNMNFHKLRKLPFIPRTQTEKERVYSEYWGIITEPEIIKITKHDNGIELEVELITYEYPPFPLLSYLSNKFYRMEIHLEFWNPLISVGYYIIGYNQLSRRECVYNIPLIDFDNFINKVKEMKWASEEDIELIYG